MPKAPKERDEHVHGESRTEDFQSILLSLANHFITLSSENIDEGINKALEELGIFAQADRSWIIQINRDAGTNTHEWCAEGIPSALSYIQNMPVDSVPWISEKLLNREVVHIPSLSALPPEAEAERELCKAQMMKGFLAVPLMYAGTLTGLAGFDMVREERAFPQGVINLLRIAGEMLGNALHRRRMEFSKKELDLRFRTVLDNLQEGVCIGDLDDRFVYVNHRYANMLGYKPEELLGKKAYRFIVPESEHSKIREGTSRRTEGKSDSYECTQVCKDGTPLTTVISATPYRNLSGEVIGHISAVIDITERRETEGENRRLQSQLMQAQKMEAVGQLAAGIAHDLNNSLSAVVGHLQLIKSAADTPVSCQHSADTALLGCKRAGALINQLLTFSRQGTIDFEKVHLDQIVNETLDLVKSVISKDVAVRTSGSAENLVVQADKTQISQALTNLVINANHAMPRGGSVSCSLSTTTIQKPELFNRDAKPGSYAVLTVRDTGSGIAPEVLPRVFEPFFTTKPQGVGTGLGLSMVYAIMQRHGGWVDVDSQLGMGTAFSLYFPLSEQIPEKAPAPKKPSTRVEMIARTGTIMVIDDEPILAELACSFLERAGFSAKAFSVPEEAFEWYRKNHSHVCLVLLDMKMPGFNGVKSFEVIRDIDPDARVVLISGYIDDSEVTKLLGQGALSFIQKPVKYTELVEWISKTVKISDPGRTSSVVH